MYGHTERLLLPASTSTPTTSTAATTTTLSSAATHCSTVDTMATTSGVSRCRALQGTCQPVLVRLATLVAKVDCASVAGCE